MGFESQMLEGFMRRGWALRRALMAGLLALLAFAPGLTLPGSAKLGLGGPAMAQDAFDIDQFYDALAPYGEWVNHPAYGYVWLPLAVQENWRPYTVGHWIDTDEYGWYWDSPEPFAWAVYHYGRWGFEPAYGWYWVPGDTWAPAWVQWRYGNDYVGWAPVAPDSYRGYAYGGPAAYAPPPPTNSWVFVRPRYLAAPRVAPYALPLSQVVIALSLAPNIYRPVYRNGYVYNYGMPRDRWSRLTHQRIEPRRIYRGNYRDRPRDWHGHNNRDLYVYAPGVRKGQHPHGPPKKVSKKPSKHKNTANVKRTAPPYAGTNPGGMNPNLRKPLPKASSTNPGGMNPNLHQPPKKKSSKKPSKSKNKNTQDAKHGLPSSARSNPGVMNPYIRKPKPEDKKKSSHAGKSKTSNKKAHSKAKSSQTKAANAKPQNGGPGGGNGSNGGHGDKGKGGKGGHSGGGNRAAACKANPDLPFCHKRGG
jgi:Family of unknown function (DUF6600)